MAWKIISTATFSREVKKFRKRRGDLIKALDKKIQRLKKDPYAVGGELAGKLHGHRSTRLIAKYRLLFQIASQQKSVYLVAIDHRKFNYERFLRHMR